MPGKVWDSMPIHDPPHDDDEHQELRSSLNAPSKIAPDCSKSYRDPRDRVTHARHDQHEAREC